MHTPEVPQEFGQLLFTIDQGASRLALSRATVQRLVASGALRSVRIGSARRIAEDDLREFVAALRATPGSDRALLGGRR